MRNVSDTLPTVLTSKSFQGIIPSTTHRNVAWSEDGQCLFITRRGVTIITPHIATTLPPPLTLVNPNLRQAAATSTGTNSRTGQILTEHESDDEPLVEINTVEEKKALGSASGKNELISGRRRGLRRPEKGEIKWWSTAIEVDRDGKREIIYGWSELGEESTALISEKEITTRQAIWSPSGLTDLGGCLLVVLTSVLQVSVYAPRSDPYAKQWDEIADLTVLTKDLLEPDRITNGFDERGMLEMRTTSMQWSPHIPSGMMTGIDGSLLALANRAGQIAFWSYGLERRFRRLQVADLKVSGQWITDMAWSAWREAGDEKFESQLALVLSDGSIRLLVVRRGVEKDITGSHAWSLQLDTPIVLDRGDRRAIAATTWVEDVLIWTKPGSVHMLAGDDSQIVSWRGLRSIRLERVGNWASANALGPCVGVHLLNSDNLLLVLSSLTAHLITSFATSPMLAPQTDSLRPALAMREAFLEYIQSDPSMRSKWKSAPFFDLAGWTAHTSGWTSVGDWGSVGTWVTEPVNFHNLDSSAEGNRYFNFFIADLGNAGSSTKDTVIQALAEVINGPTTILHSSPGRILMPYLLHILCSHECASYATPLLHMITIDLEQLSTVTEIGGDASLMTGLWCEGKVDRLRLGLVLALWCSVTFDSSVATSKAAVEQITTAISTRLVLILLHWATTVLQPSLASSLGLLDRHFLQLLLKGVGEMPTKQVSAKTQASIQELDRLLSLGASSSGGGESIGDERCPACGTAVGSEGKCEKGHVWSRCSITRLLITHPHYRVCSVCPAISLLPRRHVATPIPVDREGRDHDWQRFSGSEQSEGDAIREDWIVQMALESAVACVICGGRWMRAV
ncbi:hypothetical protein IAR55_001627 [Kwoniella newhampshirensis]|uniref:Transcription factor IIIC 90kDa subunit N-terminal domain-containing protein n=1 Tax=Kwoniella newhampshirensis TaxID=1651941 RepID=A0AAW0Z2R1_9TREE